MQHGGLCTGLPFGIEEGKGSKSKSSTTMDIAGFIVTISGGTKSSNQRTGTTKPKAVPLVASNFSIDDIPRYMYHTHMVCVCIVGIHALSACCFCDCRCLLFPSE